MLCQSYGVCRLLCCPSTTVYFVYTKRPHFQSSIHEAWSECLPMTFRMSLKFGHVGLKTRALSQIILTHQQQTAFENIVGKGEMARNKQFLFFPTMFITQSDNCSFICQYF